jgi:chromosome segregation ATPase
MLNVEAARLSALANNDYDDTISATNSEPQLELLNEPSRNSFTKLYNDSVKEKIPLAQQAKELKQELMSLKDIQLQNGQLRNQILDMQSLIEHLKERADSADIAEDVIETLSSKKALLEDRIVDLEENIRELEELRDINQELEESHLETERQLQNEIIQYEDKLSYLVMELKKERQTHEELEFKLKESRDRLRQLQATFRETEENKADIKGMKLKLGSIEQISLMESFKSLIDNEKRLVEIGPLQYKANLLMKLTLEIADKRFLSLFNDRHAIEKIKDMCLLVYNVVVFYIYFTKDPYTSIACLNVS